MAKIKLSFGESRVKPRVMVTIENDKGELEEVWNNELDDSDAIHVNYRAATVSEKEKYIRVRNLKTGKTVEEKVEVDAEEIVRKCGGKIEGLEEYVIKDTPELIQNQGMKQLLPNLINAIAMLAIGVSDDDVGKAFLA